LDLDWGIGVDRRSTDHRQGCSCPPVVGRRGHHVGTLVLPDGVEEELAAALVARAGGSGVKLTGPGGLLTGLIKQVLERGLAAELDA
jgi:hypothetical protein